MNKPFSSQNIIFHRNIRDTLNTIFTNIAKLIRDITAITSPDISIFAYKIAAYSRAYTRLEATLRPTAAADLL